MKRTPAVYTSPINTATRPNWKPGLFNPLYISLITTLHLLYIIGIQLLVKQYDKDKPEIDKIRQNITIQSPQSIFIFDETNVGGFLGWQYLPVAIATILGLLWESIDVNIRRLEPFYQLAAPEGGTADDALCLDYVDKFSFFVPFSAIKRKHSSVAISSTIYMLAASLIPTLAGGIWSIEWASLSYSLEKTDGPKFATISINSGVAIATQVFHGVIVALGIVIAVRLFRRPSRLYHDPKGLGGIAALISDADSSGANTLRLFRQIPSFAHSRVLNQSFQGIRFHLVHLPVAHADGTTQTTYQIISNTAPEHILPLHYEDRAFYRDRGDATGFWLTKRAAWIAECFLWLGQAAITGTIYQVAKIAGPDGFADRTKPTIAKMVFTLCITIGGMMWQSIQRELQVFEPWRQMSKGRGKPLYGQLIRSDVISLGLLASLAVSAVRLSVVALWANITVVMIVVATVFLPPLLELAYAAGLTSNSSMPVHAFGIVKGSTGLALAATGIAIHLVIFCNLLFLLASGRTRPFLPRRPTTIASQIVYLCRSEKLLADFAGTSMLSNEELKERLRYVTRECLFGWFWWPRGRAFFVGAEEYTQGESWNTFNFWNGLNGFQPCT